MADRTTTLMIETVESADRMAFPIENAVTLAAGTLVQLQAGRANHWDDSGSNDVFLGIVIGGDDEAKDGIFLGDTSGAPDPDPEIHVDTSGAILKGVTVEGVNGASLVQGDVGKVVFCADSDTANLTIVSTTNTNTIGWITRFNSATDANVKLLTPSEYIAANYESAGS